MLHVAPPRPAPLVELAQFDAAHSHRGAATAAAPAEPRPVGGRRVCRRVAGAWVARQLTRRGITYTSLRQDLALTGRTFEQAMTRKVLFAAAGLLLALLLLVAVPAAVGAALPAGAPLVVAVLLAAGVVLPARPGRQGGGDPAAGGVPARPGRLPGPGGAGDGRPAPHRPRRCRRRRRSAPAGRWR